MNSVAKITGVTMPLSEWLKINESKYTKKYDDIPDDDIETKTEIYYEAVHEFKGNVFYDREISDRIGAYAYWDETEQYDRWLIIVGICTNFGLWEGCSLKERSRKEDILKKWLQEKNINYEIEEYLVELY